MANILILILVGSATFARAQGVLDKLEKQAVIQNCQLELSFSEGELKSRNPLEQAEIALAAADFYNRLSDKEVLTACDEMLNKKIPMTVLAAREVFDLKTLQVKVRRYIKD